MRMINNVTKYLLTTLLAFLCIFSSLLDNSIVFAASAGIANSGVLEDLEGSTIDGEAFDISDYNFDTTKDLRILAFIEYGYTFKPDKRNNYALYVYIYNPQGLAFDDDSALNYIQMSYVGDNYSKYPLRFIDKSMTAGYEGMFYKYEISLTDTQRQSMFESLNSNAREYKVSGIELLKEGGYNATEFEVANVYTYSGYAKGYGPDAATDDTLKCSSNGIETLTLNVHGAAYTPDGTNGENNYTQDMLHSVYFAVPNYIVNKYGGISKIWAKWLNAVTKPIFVTDNQEVYNALLPDVGETIPAHKDYRETQPYGFRSDIAIYNAPAGTMTGEEINALYYLFLANDENSFVNDDEQYVLNGDEVLDYMREYSDNHLVTGADPGVGYKKYRAELFSQYDTEYTKVEVEADDNYSLTNEKLTQTFWEKIFGLQGTQVIDSAFENVNAIYKVKASDMTGDPATVCENLYINESYYDEFKSFYYDAVANGKTVFLFRYYQSEYKCDVADVEKWVGTLLQPDLYRVVDGKHYVAQTHVTIDFDIIKVRFTKGQVNTDIPVVMSPIDIVPDLEPPVVDYFDWMTVAVLLTVSVGGIIITRIIKREANTYQRR